MPNFASIDGVSKRVSKSHCRASRIGLQQVRQSRQREAQLRRVLRHDEREKVEARRRHRRRRQGLDRQRSGGRRRQSKAESA